jgi:hypothetical protein
MRDTFRFFIRKKWKDAGEKLSNKEIDGLGIEFEKYLNDNISEENRFKILPLNEMDVIFNMDNPMRDNGFSFAYVMHFYQFIEKLKSA